MNGELFEIFLKSIKATHQEALDFYMFHCFNISKYITHFCRIRDGGGEPPSPHQQFRRSKLTLALDRELIEESDSF